MNRNVVVFSIPRTSLSADAKGVVAIVVQVSVVAADFRAADPNFLAVRIKGSNGCSILCKEFSSETNLEWAVIGGRCNLGVGVISIRIAIVVNITSRIIGAHHEAVTGGKHVVLVVHNIEVHRVKDGVAFIGTVCAIFGIIVDQCKVDTAVFLAVEGTGCVGGRRFVGTVVAIFCAVVDHLEWNGGAPIRTPVEFIIVAGCCVITQSGRIHVSAVIPHLFSSGPVFSNAGVQ